MDDLNDRELYNYIPILEYLSQVNNVQEVIPKMVTNNELDYAKCNNLIKYSQKDSFKLKDYKDSRDLKENTDKPSINIKIINHNFNNYIVKNEDNKNDFNNNNNNQKYNDNSEIIPSVKNLTTKGKYSVNFTSNNNQNNNISQVNQNSNINPNISNNNQDDKKNKTKSFRDSIGDSSISNLTSNNFFQQKSKINSLIKSSDGPVQLVDNIDKIRRIEKSEKTDRNDKYEKIDRYADNEKSIPNNTNNNINIGYKFEDDRKKEKNSFLNNPLSGYNVNSNDNLYRDDKKTNSSQIIRPGTANSISKQQYHHNRDYSNNLYMQGNQQEKQEIYKMNKKPSFDQKNMISSLRMIDSDLIGNSNNTPMHMHSRTPSYTLNKNLNIMKMNNLNINTARDDKSSKEKRNLNNTIKSKNSKMELDINAKINSIYNNAMINIGENYPKSVKQISVVKISSNLPNSNSTVLSGLGGGSMKSDDSKSRLLKTQSKILF